MARFDNHIKMNWGFGIDESLEEGQEVKFTIIATGFGIEAIPEMKDWKDEEALRLIQEEASRKEKDIDRVRKVYDNFNMTITVNRASQSSIVILTPEEMDNDEFINFLEKHPTFNRSPKEIAKIRKPPKDIMTKGQQPVDEKSASDASLLIEF